MDEEAGCVLYAGAKVNLYLKILGRREDGLHELESVFLPLSRPRDRLSLRPAPPGTGLDLSCSERSLESRDNILHTVYQAFAERSGNFPDLRVHLEKEIPSGAGLGGGSSNAAVFLQYLNALFKPDRALSVSELRELALRIGSDVPFFLTNQPALVSGVGEKLRPLNLDLGSVKLLLVCPECRVSTAEAYQSWDRRQNRGVTGDTQQKDLTVTSRRFTKSFRFSGFLCWNDFEQVILNAFPKLRSLKQALLTQGAAAVTLTGSGSALVALFHSQMLLAHASSWLDEHQVSHFISENWGVAKR